MWWSSSRWGAGGGASGKASSKGPVKAVRVIRRGDMVRVSRGGVWWRRRGAKCRTAWRGEAYVGGLEVGCTVIGVEDAGGGVWVFRRKMAAEVAMG